MGSVLMRRGTSDDAPEIEEEVNGPEDGVELELEKKDPMMRNIEGRGKSTHGQSPMRLHSIIYRYMRPKFSRLSIHESNTRLVAVCRRGVARWAKLKIPRPRSASYTTPVLLVESHELSSAGEEHAYGDRVSQRLALKLCVLLHSIRRHHLHYIACL